MNISWKEINKNKIRFYMTRDAAAFFIPNFSTVYSNRYNFKYAQLVYNYLTEE